MDAFVAGNELAFCDGDFFLERGILLDELSLHHSKLFKIAFKEHHLLLLGTVVGCAEHIVILLSRLVQ